MGGLLIFLLFSLFLTTCMAWILLLIICLTVSCILSLALTPRSQCVLYKATPLLLAWSLSHFYFRRALRQRLPFFRTSSFGIQVFGISRLRSQLLQLGVFVLYTLHQLSLHLGNVCVLVGVRLFPLHIILLRSTNSFVDVVLKTMDIFLVKTLLCLLIAGFDLH